MNHEKPALAIRTHLRGARQSVYITCDDSLGWTFPIPIKDVTAICDSKLDLRYLIRSKSEQSKASIEQLKQIVGNTWQVRATSNDAPTAHCIIIDNKLIYAKIIDPPDATDELYFVNDLSSVKTVTDMFEEVWKGYDEFSSIVTLYENIIRPSIIPSEQKIITSSKQFWDSMIRRLAAQPELMHKLPPRKFEELIAELLKRDGLDVTLTPKTRDGGRDILAKSAIFKNHLYLVECKKQGPTNPVGVSIVRQLYGVLTQERATAAMVATTSTFTKPALQFRQPIKFQMDLKDFYDLRNWIKNVDSNQNPRII